MKYLVHWIFVILNFPSVISYLLLAKVFNQNELIATFSQFYSLIPGKIGNYSRAAFYRFTLNYCASHAVISFATIFSQRNTDIHDDVYIGPQCNIGSCSIDQNCLLGSGVHILSGKNQHNFSDTKTPIKEQGGEYMKVVIGANCWIGNNATIMANVGDNCVIAAGSVVVNDLPAMTIAGGNPAKVIRMRDE